MDLVSVIVPTYKRDSSLVRALESLENQTYKNIEVVVVNDCVEEAWKEYYTYGGMPLTLLQKSDEEKAAEKESENQTKINEAEQRALVAEAKAEAMLLGVKSQYVEDIVTLALSRMTEDADLNTIIGEFKTKYPTWFGESDDAEGKNKGNDKIGQKGTGSSVKNADKSKNGDESKGIGARLAAQRKSSNKKSNYWGKK